MKNLKHSIGGDHSATPVVPACKVTEVIFRHHAVTDHRRVQISVWYGASSIYRVNSMGWPSVRKAYYAARRLARLAELQLYIKTPGRPGAYEAP